MRASKDKRKRAFSRGGGARPAPRPFGDRRHGPALARALDPGRAGDALARALTHGFHAYPARMHPATARRILAALDLATPSTVLDPFCGSGTVVVEALAAGHRGVGVDLNPLAVELARVRSWRVNEGDLEALVIRAREIAKAAPNRRAQRARLPEELKEWFPPHVFPEIAALTAEVRKERDAARRQALRLILSSILVKVSLKESDSSWKKVAKKVPRGLASRAFADRAMELALGLADLWGKTRAEHEARIHLADARKLPLGDGSVDAVVTSPPYAGTYDYADHHRLRLILLGMDSAAFAAGEMGPRRHFAKDPRRALAAWRRDTAGALREIHRVLRPGGRAVLLVGDSVAGDRGIDARELTETLAATAGLRTVAGASQDRPALGAYERDAFPRGKREHLMWLVRED